jgi:hypothetical protein
VAGHSPVDRRKKGMKRSLLVDGTASCLAGFSRAPTRTTRSHLDTLDRFGPLPDDTTVHLDAGYDSGKTWALLAVMPRNV